MSLAIATTRVAASTGGGNQDITTSKLGGLTPKAAIFIATWATSDGTATDHAVMSVGFTDGTNHSVSVTSDEHNQATSDSYRRGASDEVVMILDPTDGTIECEANFNSWLTNGVRITWGVTPPSAFLISVIFFAGTDLSAYVDDGGGSALGCGFTPNVGIFASHRAAFTDTTASNASLSLGVCVNDGSETQYSINISGADNSPTTENSQMASDDAATENIYKTSVFTPFVVTGWTSNGFTYTGDLSGYLLLNFNNNYDVKLQKYTMPTSTGSNAITGVGFKPQAVILGLCSETSWQQSTTTTGSVFSAGISLIDDTDQYCNVIASADSQSTSDTQSLADDTTINIPDHAGANLATASFTSFDSDGLTLNYSAAPQARVAWLLAFEEEAAGDLSVNVSDDVDVSDSVAFNLPGYSLSVNVSDDVTATDSTTIFLPFLTVDIQDNATVTDTVDVDILTSIAVQDDATVTDTATVDIPFLVAVQDNATATDSVTVAVVVDVTVQDDATATDSVTADIIINITAQNDATATDSVTVSVQAAGAVDVNVSDDATATDSIISYILLETSVQDDVTATDSATVQIEAELYLDLFISPQNNYVQIV